MVENEPESLEATCELIRMIAHEAFPALDANEARKALRMGPSDVLLTDLRLPGMSGSDIAVEALRIDTSLRVIVASGQFPDSGGLSGLESPEQNGWRLLLKPFTVKQLQEPGSHVHTRQEAGRRQADRTRWMGLSKASGRQGLWRHRSRRRRGRRRLPPGADRLARLDGFCRIRSLRFTNKGASRILPTSSKLTSSFNSPFHFASLSVTWTDCIFRTTGGDD